LIRVSYEQPCTIGVAITIPDPWGSELQERRAAYGDAIAWTIPTHITLLPPTQVRPERLGEVDAHLRDVARRTSAFQVELRGTDTFRPVTQTSFLAVVRGGPECERLADGVRLGPLRRSLPFPYHPHVTMAVDLDDEVHDLVEAEFATFRLAMPVDTFERFELADHGAWEPVAEFPLARSRE
jgi:2'-5' RNA ligase